MAQQIAIYFGGIAKKHDGSFEWHYGAIQVKETPKQYQMLEEADKQDWHSGYKGMIIPKKDFSTFGNLLSWRGHLSLENSESEMKKFFQKNFEENIELTEYRLKEAIAKGKIGSRHKNRLEELKAMLMAVQN